VRIGKKGQKKTGRKKGYRRGGTKRIKKNFKRNKDPEGRRVGEELQGGKGIG